MKCKCGTNARKAQSGFTTIVEIWWCDNCKDEAKPDYKVDKPSMNFGAQDCNAFYEAFKDRFKSSKNWYENNLKQGESNEEKYIRIQDVDPKDRSNVDFEWLRQLPKEERTRYYSKWLKLGGPSRRCK